MNAIAGSVPGPRLFLTTTEVAQILDCDPRTVHRAIGAGTMPAVRLSDKTVRIPAWPFLRDVCGLDVGLIRALNWDVPLAAGARVAPGVDAGATAENPNLTIGPGEPHHERQPTDSPSRYLRAICEPNPGRSPAPEPPAA